MGSRRGKRKPPSKIRCLSFSAGCNKRKLCLDWLWFCFRRLREHREIRAIDRRKKLENWTLDMFLAICILRPGEAQCCTGKPYAVSLSSSDA